MQLTIKAGEELTDKEFDQINKVSLREFQVGLTSVKKLEGRILFLLLENQSILAQGQLIPIAPVAFNDGYYSLLGIGGIIAHEKGKGFGKQIMTAVKSYLVSRNKTGVGFCMPKNKVFYEKCGFMINTDSTERFVYRENGKKITDQWGQYIFYHESADRFMEKILSHPDKEILLPIPPTW